MENDDLSKKDWTFKSNCGGLTTKKPWEDKEQPRIGANWMIYGLWWVQAQHVQLAIDSQGNL
jgi:hypothetical protein